MHLSIISWSTVPRTPSTAPSCPLSQISFTIARSLIYLLISPVRSLYEVFKHVLGRYFFSSLRSFVFGSNIVLPDGHHTGIKSLLSLIFSSALFDALCADLNFFHQYSGFCLFLVLSSFSSCCSLLSSFSL